MRTEQIEECLRLLREKQAELTLAGETRYPRRSDFSVEQTAAIKAAFGPFPRALEAAGLKPPRKDSAAERSKQKRIRSARVRNAARKAAKRAEKTVLSESEEKCDGFGLAKG